MKSLVPFLLITCLGATAYADRMCMLGEPYSPQFNSTHMPHPWAANDPFMSTPGWPHHVHEGIRIYDYPGSDERTVAIVPQFAHGTPHPNRYFVVGRRLVRDLHEPSLIVRVLSEHLMPDVTFAHGSQALMQHGYSDPAVFLGGGAFGETYQHLEPYDAAYTAYGETPEGELVVLVREETAIAEKVKLFRYRLHNNPALGNRGYVLAKVGETDINDALAAASTQQTTLPRFRIGPAMRIAIDPVDGDFALCGATDDDRFLVSIFDASGAYLTHWADAASNDGACRDVGFSSDGSLYAAGHRDADGLLVRFDASHRFDTSFGSNGTLVERFDHAPATPGFLALDVSQPPVQIVAITQFELGGTQEVYLYDASGARAPAFGTNGVASLDGGRLGPGYDGASAAADVHFMYAPFTPHCSLLSRRIILAGSVVWNGAAAAQIPRYDAYTLNLRMDGRVDVDFSPAQGGLATLKIVGNDPSGAPITPEVPNFVVPSRFIVTAAQRKCISASEGPIFHSQRIAAFGGSARFFDPYHPDWTTAQSRTHQAVGTTTLTRLPECPDPVCDHSAGDDCGWY